MLAALEATGTISTLLTNSRKVNKYPGWYPKTNKAWTGCSLVGSREFTYAKGNVTECNRPWHSISL